MTENKEQDTQELIDGFEETLQQEKKAKDDRMTNGVMLVVALWLIIAKPALAAAILLFGVLVAIHEAGHMILAKWSGMRVDRFSIGMGPALYSFKRGETEYVLAPLPLGGYVHIAGLDPEEEGAANDPRAFDNRPLFGRVMAILGGPLANYISAAFLVFLLAFGLGGRWAVGIGRGDLGGIGILLRRGRRRNLTSRWRSLRIKSAPPNVRKSGWRTSIRRTVLSS